MRNTTKSCIIAISVWLVSTFILTACTNAKENAPAGSDNEVNPGASTSSAKEPGETAEELTPSPAEEEDDAAAGDNTEDISPAPNKETEETELSVVYDRDSALKDVYSDYFLMGAAINGSSVSTAAINHEGMAEILKKHFNSTTLSNLMKPSYLLDQAGSKENSDGMPALNFGSIDPSLQFCLDNGIKMRGHTLVWHNQTPEWFFHEDYDVSKELADAVTMELRLESYIKQVLEYCQENYPGVIYCWDVVNEAISDDGRWRMTDSYWYTIMKETYIEKAFYYARKYAGEEVKLFYNDYNVFVSAKRLAIYTMAHDLKQKGLIDGLGLQPTVGLITPELDSDVSSSSFKKTLERFAELGLEIQITELSFEIDGKVNQITPENLQKQADRYYEMMNLLLKSDSDNGGPCNITSVTVFGICDDYPLYTNHQQNLYLWDKEVNPKPCFYSYLQAGLDWQAKK